MSRPNESDHHADTARPATPGPDAAEASNPGDRREAAPAPTPVGPRDPKPATPPRPPVKRSSGGFGSFEG